MNEETNISAGTPPTNSVGTGVETSLPPAVEPPGTPRGSKVVRRWQKKKRKKIYESKTVYAFKVSMSDLGDMVVYAKNETQLKNKLRKYFRDMGQIINIERVFATDVIDFYTNKRSKAMKRIADVVLEQMEKPTPDQDPQAAKQDQAKKAQQAKLSAQKRIALAKQNMQKQLQQKKIEMQKSIVNQQRTLQQKAKTGSLEPNQG
jgi:hypothetical protein